MNTLILGLVVFFGVHSISMLALPWRERMVLRLGTRAWQALYSVVALVGFYLVVRGYGEARIDADIIYTTPPAFRYAAAILMLPFFTLLLASVFAGRIRILLPHPLLLSAMLWSVAHLLVNGSVADLLLFGPLLLWAVCVRISLARRPARKPIALPSSATNDVIAVAGGLALYVAFTGWLHAGWFGVPIWPL